MAVANREKYMCSNCKNTKEKNPGRNQSKILQNYGSSSTFIETWTLRKRDRNRIQAAEMKYLRTVKGCTRLNQIRNEDIRNELDISPLSEKIIECKNKWKARLQRMEHTRIPLDTYKYQPSGKLDIDRPRRRWRETTILEAGTGDSPNP
jgi:hypothetical protein